MAGSLRQFAFVGTAVAVTGGVAYALWRNYLSTQEPPGRDDQQSRLRVQEEGTGPPAGQDIPSNKQILVLGLDGAGKTSVLYSLATNHVKRNTVPTKGFNAVCVNTEETKMEFLEIGGSESLREYWKMYMPRVLLLIYVVDSADHERFPVAKTLLHQLVQNNSTLPVMILANKQSIPLLVQLWTNVRDLETFFSSVFCIAIEAIAETSRTQANFCNLSETKTEREISKAARRAEATPRLQQLAHPVVRKQMQFYENTCMEAPIRQIPLTTLQAVPSPRLLELARPKTIPSESAMDRSPEWPVSAAAKQAVASPRLMELSHPASRAPTNLVQFNPDAFIVKESAKRAFCTERVKTLAQPITR